MNSKIGVNFQVVLQQSHAKRNCVRKDLPVLNENPGSVECISNSLLDMFKQMIFKSRVLKN
jgi:hypothetical protein